MAGGESASRAMVAGMVIGAHLGIEALPENWLKALKKGDDIRRLLAKMG